MPFRCPAHLVFSHTLKGKPCLLRAVKNEHQAMCKYTVEYKLLNFSVLKVLNFEPLFSTRYPNSCKLFQDFCFIPVLSISLLHSVSRVCTKVS